MADKIKEIPYGISDFEKIIKQNKYFVDKTRFIKLIEKHEYVFFIRPRRFGKSLFLNLLESYYDINKKDMFDKLFGKTDIGRNPTDIRNSYKIFKFNFSIVNPTPDKLEESFEKYVNSVIKYFVEKYKDDYSPDFVKYLETEDTFTAKLNSLFMETKKHKTKIYVLIDEYDNFTNTILSAAGSRAYQKLTHGEGFLRHFFAVLKGGATDSGSGLDRLLITGVSPVTLDDVTSGFNIGTNISMLSTFNQMLGFTEDEVKDMLNYYKSAGLLKEDPDNCLEIMHKWYDGYIFSEDADTALFNTDMTMYFVRELIMNNRIPKRLTDQNVKIDYGKLRHLIVMSKKLNGNFESLKQIIEKETIESEVADSFPLDKLTSPNNFISLLYYFGLLTFRGINLGASVLSIPNLAVKELMYGYIRDAYDDLEIFRIDMQKLSKFAREMGWTGKWEEFFKFISQEVKQQTTIRDYLKGEKVIQGFLLAYLSITDIFIPHTEYETGKGYSDFFLEPFTYKYPDMRFGYLIELKYINRKTKLTSQLIDKLKKEAETQLKKYDTGLKISQDITIVKIILIYHGWQLADMQKL